MGRKVVFSLMILALLCEMPGILSTPKAFARRAYSSYGDVEVVEVYTQPRSSRVRRPRPAIRRQSAVVRPVESSIQELGSTVVSKAPLAKSKGTGGLSPQAELLPPTSLDALKKQYEQK